MSDSQRLEVVERYKTGESANALAREYGLHRTTVLRALRDVGVEVRYRVMTDDDLAVASALYEPGLSLAAIGERFGVAARTVLNGFSRAAVPTRAVGTNQWKK